MRKIRAELKFVVTEIIEIEITDKELKDWSDREILSELKYSELNQLSPENFYDCDLDEVYTSTRSHVDRHLQVVWGDDE